MNIFQKFHQQNCVRTASHPHSSVLISFKNTIISTVLTILNYSYRRLSSLSCNIPNNLDNWHRKVARLLVMNTGPLYPQNTPRSLFCWRLSRTQDHIAAGNMEKFQWTATFRLVAQCLNQMSHRGPQITDIECRKLRVYSKLFPYLQFWNLEERLMISKLRGPTCLRIWKLFTSPILSWF